MANFYQYTLKAGQEVQAGQSGKLIVVDSVVGADGVDITPMFNNGTGRTMPNRKKGFKCWTDYDAVVLKANADCVVSLFLSTSDVSLGFTDGSSVNVAGGVSILNGADARIPVDLAGGNVTVNAAGVTISNTTAAPVPTKEVRGVTVVDLAAVVVGVAAVKIVGDATLSGLRIRNNSAANKLALGGAGVTMANAAVILQPGETWVENDVPGANWYGISDAAGADVRAQGVK
jgi:hypothetical protein